MSLHTAVTAEHLLEMDDLGRCELVKGEIIRMAPAGAEHGYVSLNLGIAIGTYVKRNDLGRVYGAETGFIIARHPDTVRAPDVAFVRKHRVPAQTFKGYFPGAPDLAIEVISFNDRKPDVLSKVAEWLVAGTISVWLVDPVRQSISVHREHGQTLKYGVDDQLLDDAALPGFVLNVRAIFSA